MQTEPPRDPGAIALESRARTAAVVRSAIDNLRERSSLSLTLHYLDQMTLAEAAWVMSLPESSVRIAVEEGLEQLRKSLLRAGIGLSPKAALAVLVAHEISAIPPSFLSQLEITLSSFTGAGENRTE